MSDVLNGETKAQFRERLSREGRWDTFVQRRNAMKANGVSAVDAWRLLREGPEFQPISLVQQAFENRAKSVVFEDGVEVNNNGEEVVARLPSSKEMFDLVSKSKGGKHVSMTEVVRWVFENMDNPNATMEEAPCMGAYSLLSWVKEKPGNKAEFYRAFAVKLMPTKNEVDQQMSFVDDGRKLFQRLDQYEAALIADQHVD